MLGKKLSKIIACISIITLGVTIPTNVNTNGGLIVNQNEKEKLQILDNVILQPFLDRTPQEFKEKIKELERHKEEEERLKREEEERIRKEEEQKRIWEENNRAVTLVCTFYTHLPEEGSGTGITASGLKVREGIIASNNFEFGTIIDIYDNEFINSIGLSTNQFVVADTGNPNYIKQLDTNKYKVDIYVPQWYGESERQYRKRVLNYGIHTIQASIRKNEKISL